MIIIHRNDVLKKDTGTQKTSHVENIYACIRKSTQTGGGGEDRATTTTFTRQHNQRKM